MLDASVVANSIAPLLQLYTSTKLLNAYGPWSVVKRRVSENASCSRVVEDGFDHSGNPSIDSRFELHK
jgi:hypothetical protein